MTEAEYNKTISEYNDKFGAFPLFEAPQMSTAELIRVMRECIESRKEYEPPEPEDDAIY